MFVCVVGFMFMVMVCVLDVVVIVCICLCSYYYVFVMRLVVVGLPFVGVPCSFCFIARAC